MVGFAFCILAIALTFAMARRSLGAGLQALVIVGYFYGVGRGRYPDLFSHFPFDCSLATLYGVHFLTRRPSPEAAHRSGVAASWVKALTIWPIICLAYSPMLPTSQPLAVQIVGLRGAVIMLPCLILGAQLQRSDCDKLAAIFGVMNLVALGFALIEYVYGIGVIVPHNLNTDLIYASNDISAGGESYHRIPSIFTSSHSYGAAMALSVPFLVHGLEGGKRMRLVCLAGLGASIIGIFLCGARLPVIMLGCATLYVLFTLRIRRVTFFGLLVVGACAYYAVTHNARLQRFETLGDTEQISGRFNSSVNKSFIDVLGEYPLGAGLASAAGTSIPYFLGQLANPPVGIESEFAHALVEQGIIGLLLLVGLVSWTITRTRVPWNVTQGAAGYASSLAIANWLSGAIGVGLFAGMPTSAMLLLLTGMQMATRAPEKAKLALRHVGSARKPAVRAPPIGAPARAQISRAR